MSLLKWGLGAALATLFCLPLVVFAFIGHAEGVLAWKGDHAALIPSDALDLAKAHSVILAFLSAPVILAPPLPVWGKSRGLYPALVAVLLCAGVLSGRAPFEGAWHMGLLLALLILLASGLRRSPIPHLASACMAVSIATLLTFVCLNLA